MHTLFFVEVVWDGGKAEANRRKRGISFESAAEVLYDELALTITDLRAGELRLVKIGADSFGNVLIVVYALRGTTHRLISARRATTRERRRYSEGK